MGFGDGDDDDNMLMTRVVCIGDDDDVILLLLLLLLLIPRDIICGDGLGLLFVDDVDILCVVDTAVVAII
jgi:hypothetical protein